MDLILWRHAEAQDGFDDLARELTARGAKQAQSMAQWLLARLPAQTLILASPAVRCQQTALALERDFTTVPELAPGADYAHVLAAAGWPEGTGAVLVVGHQPTLGQVVSLLLTGEPRELSVRKGAVFWLTHRPRREHAQVVLKAVQSTDLL